MTGRRAGDAALDLLTLAHEVQAGRVTLPRDGAGPARVGGCIVVEREVHRVICGCHVVARLDPEPGWPALVLCHGCGLAHPAAERERHRIEHEPPVPLDERDDWPPCERDAAPDPSPRRRPRRVGGGEVVRMPHQRRAR